MVSTLDDSLDGKLASAVDAWLEEGAESELSDETPAAELDSELVWDSLDDRLETLEVGVAPPSLDVLPRPKPLVAVLLILVSETLIVVDGFP